MKLSSHFERTEAPGTGRPAIQLTSGPDFCYPLYYFIPSITADGRHLVYYREKPGPVHEISLHCLDLVTAESVLLASSESGNAHWQPWGVDPARGILGDRAALSVQRNMAVYMDGGDVVAVDVATGKRRQLLHIPDDRFPLAQNCVAGQGDWFVYVHADRAHYDRLLAQREQGRDFRKLATQCEGTELCAVHLETGEQRVLLRINYPIHHVHAYGARHLVFSHVPGHRTGMGVTDLDGGWYSVLRTPDAHGGRIVHHVPTARGIAYELTDRGDGSWAGLYDPFTHARCEFRVCDATSHTGLDPAGISFFYQTGDNRIEALVRHRPEGPDRWQRLVGPWRTWGRGQKSHLHPRLTPDRQWIQMVGGDARTETNHIFFVGVSDLPVTTGLPAPTRL